MPPPSSSAVSPFSLLSDDLLRLILSLLSHSSHTAALAACCSRTAALAAPLLAADRRRAQETEDARPWSDKAAGPAWSFCAHARRGAAAWRGCWNLHVGADRRCVLAHRASPSATKETRWYGAILEWRHAEGGGREAEYGRLIASFSHTAFSVPYQLPWRVRRRPCTPLTGVGSARAASSRRLQPPDGATQWALCADGVLVLGGAARLDLAIPPPCGTQMGAAALGFAGEWHDEEIEVNWLEAVDQMEK